MKKFKYTGNIAHIKAFIDRNSSKLSCATASGGRRYASIVEIYVREPTKGELDGFEIYHNGCTSRAIQGKERKRAKPAARRDASDKKVEAIPREIFRAHMERRKITVSAA